MNAPTNDEILRVRQWECKWRGHSYSEIEAYGHDGPVKVVCTNCGASWAVAPTPEPRDA